MEDVLSKLVAHSVNYAIRSGIALTTGYAINAGSRLLKSVKGTEKDEIADLQARLRSKINIISPPIDMIELIAARGNTTLDSALTLTKQLRIDIQDLGTRLNEAASDEEKIRRRSPNAKSIEQMGLELKQIIAQMKRLLTRVEDAVPLLMLAITTSGASLSTALPASVSPSRLLQSSTFLSHADMRYAALPGQSVQVGPEFNLSVYMLFAAHAHRPVHEEGITDTTWKEVIRKARVRLLRTPLARLYDFPSMVEFEAHAANSADEFPAQDRADEFAYQIMMVEDLEDDRFHEEEGETFEGVARAGIREIVPIHQVSKVFYADTGKLLKIGSEGEPNNPILLIKRDQDAVPPRRMVQEDDESEVGAEQDLPQVAKHIPKPHNPKGFPPDLDPEWIALEVYTEAPDSSDEDDYEADPTNDIGSSPPSVTAHTRSSDYLTNMLSGFRLRGSPGSGPPSPTAPQANFTSSQMTQTAQPEDPVKTSFSPASGVPPLRSSLSLLELLVRLTALQQFQQASHLSIQDEFLNFFLSGSSSTGAGADSDYRKRVRRDARMRVGFDPYDESPIKPRGEAYIYDNGYRSEHDEEDWQDWQRQSRSSPGLPSPAQHGTPSPSLRKNMQQGMGNSGARSRSQQLRQDLGGYERSPLGRSDSDSTLGTSPGMPEFGEVQKR